MRKLTYFIACSIDGFIGGPDGDASFMYPFVDEASRSSRRTWSAGSGS
ncbi:bifunctional deaminase-reductase domain-containing protein [Streptomyces sp. OM5714]|nr:bifunctional deaminase-reductase domain-containing protein [Streptomyces sp. OM5714]